MKMFRRKDDLPSNREIVYTFIKEYPGRTYNDMKEPLKHIPHLKIIIGQLTRLGYIATDDFGHYAIKTATTEIPEQKVEEKPKKTYKKHKQEFKMNLYLTLFSYPVTENSSEIYNVLSKFVDVLNKNNASAFEVIELKHPSLIEVRERNK